MDTYRKQNVEPEKSGTKDRLVRVLFHSYKISNLGKKKFYFLRMVSSMVKLLSKAQK